MKAGERIDATELGMRTIPYSQAAIPTVLSMKVKHELEARKSKHLVRWNIIAVLHLTQTGSIRYNACLTKVWALQLDYYCDCAWEVQNYDLANQSDPPRKVWSGRVFMRQRICTIINFLAGCKKTLRRLL